MPRANFLCNAWPIARTPIGVLSFESSFPPLAHFLIAENISNQCTDEKLVIQLRIYQGHQSTLGDEGKTFLKETPEDAQKGHLHQHGGRLGYPAKTSLNVH